MAKFTYHNIQLSTEPSPAIQLHIYSPLDKNMKASVEAIIDSASPITCIPEELIDEIGADNLEYEVINVRGATGRRTEMQTLIVNLRLASCNFRNISVLLIPKQYALIGRDIINKYKITLNGLKKEWEIHVKC